MKINMLFLIIRQISKKRKKSLITLFIGNAVEKNTL